MEAVGFWMLAAVAALLIGTGLPVLLVLIGVAMATAAAGIVAGALDTSLMSALPSRIIGLLENDLLQALPLYVLMGALLDRMPLADTLFRVGVSSFRRTPAAPRLSA